MSAHSFAMAALAAAVFLTPLVYADPALPDAQALIAAGEAQLAQGKAEEAITTLQQAVAADPKSSLAHLRLGGARLMRQENRAAIADFRNAIGADPNNADAFVGMAVAYLHSGDYALARAALGEAKRVAPAKAAEIDRVLSYLDEREGAAGPASH